MKKVLIIVGLVLGFALCAVATFFVTNYFHNKETEQLTSQIATLNSNLEAIGPVVPCYTVQSATFPGQELTEDNIIEQSIPQNLKNDTFATKEDIIGLYSKIAITPGTPITKDMVMETEIIDSLREVDISGNRWPIGLKEGDYVDLRITYPRGEDFIVLSHKRVMSITDQTLKVYLTEEEQQLYQAALVDFYLSRSYGSDLYLTKYVEPGIQQEAGVFYSVPSNIEAVCRKDPNIIDLAQVTVESTMRALIDAARAEFPDGDNSGGNIKGGRDELNSKVNTDFSVYEVEEEKREQEAANAENGGNSSLITDVTTGVQ